MFFSERMAALAKSHGQHPALIDQDVTTTFAELHAQSLQLAGNLAAQGIGPKDRVAVWLPNCLAWLQTFLACAHLGATVLAVNTRFRSQEVADIVSDYFHMLTLELAGQNVNKTAHRRALMQRLSGRPDGSVERKHQNISAILIELGCPYIGGYKPLPNYQRLLREAVIAHMSGDRSFDATALSAA